MTVGDNLHQALTGLETAKSTLEGFSQDTNDELAQDMYTQCAQQIEQVANQLEERVNYVENEEPQYKQKQQMQNQQGQQGQQDQQNQ
ncbi:DUF1657 domain-containing protein [Natroniella acetigena]|uniref:DUF1657 domain-containing protein n=1 Tax=Natroniella acetigena TaxID=52004 RepID=UPI00200B362A|nr:DUF1657 domain-containing protein [Natroniella acetigena]MCK8827384.1 DUF1657 domain-containing protein [Natroniella acetigena]